MQLWITRCVHCIWGLKQFLLVLTIIIIGNSFETYPQPMLTAESKRLP